MIRNAKIAMASIDSNMSVSQLRRRALCSNGRKNVLPQLLWTSTQRMRVGFPQLHRDVSSTVHTALCRDPLHRFALKPPVPTAKIPDNKLSICTIKEASL